MLLLDFLLQGVTIFFGVGKFFLGGVGSKFFLGGVYFFWEGGAKNLKEKYGKFSNIRLLAPIYNQKKLDLLRGNATVYIHGHSAGGTNPSLVEAMYLGLPIMAYGVSYNKTTTENKALYFNDVESLVALIKNITIKDMNEIGSAMKSIAERRYSRKNSDGKT